MQSSTHFIPLQFILILPFLPFNSAQFAFLNSQCGNATYPSNSTYQSNLKRVLNSLSSNTAVTYGFFNASAGQYPDIVQGIVLCRGDVPAGACRVCVRSSAAALLQACPNSKHPFGYTDNCIIFLSNDTIFHQFRDRPRWTLWNTKNSINITGFNRSIYDMMNTLQNKASLGDSKRKVATGVVNVTGNQTLYGMVQCRPDLSRVDCVKCIQWILSDLYPKYITKSNFTAAGERTVCPSCTIRYELYPFYGNVSEVASPPALSPSASNRSNPTQVGRRKKSHKNVVVIVAVLGSIGVIVAASICFLLQRKKCGKFSTKLSKEDMETLQSLQYSFGTVKVATQDFSIDSKIGEGGFGTVYLGKLPDGQEIAVKRLSGNSGQGNTQFKNEILLLAKLQHRNLVRLLGFCLEQEEMILIYELVKNKSLDNFIFDPVQRASMDWKTRFKVIDGIARGLLYLHEDSRLRIIHRDLKAGNVLLDGEFNPKIADFGMARLFNIDQTQAVASRIVGTYGYMPPEYVLHGQVSVKLDVFSFGVLVLETISGQMISSFQIKQNPENLLSFAWKNWMEGTAWNLVDTTLSNAYSSEILRCMHIGLLCVQQNLSDRPNMSAVALMLSSHSVSLQVPSQPGFYARSRTPSGVPSLGNTGSQSGSGSAEYSVNEVSVTEPYPR